jgi:hypothetical protein
MDLQFYVGLQKDKSESHFFTFMNNNQQKCQEPCSAELHYGLTSDVARLSISSKSRFPNPSML